MPVPKLSGNKAAYKLLMPVLLAASGVVLHLLGWFDWREFIQQGEEYAHTWWFAPTVIAVQVAFYAFALPGSVMFWAAGLFYDPVPATMIIVAGGAGGAAAAYALARNMSKDASGQMEKSRFFGLLQKHADPASLCAARILPNFPHSVINYGAGMLKVPFAGFIASTLAGFAVKGYLYASMIRRAVTAGDLSDAFDIRTAGTLIIIAALFIAGKIALDRQGQGSG
jgi:uncharacterized membrane protein YdjX (TVP38/TMEM64 family)